MDRGVLTRLSVSPDLTLFPPLDIVVSSRSDLVGYLLHVRSPLGKDKARTQLTDKMNRHDNRFHNLDHTLQLIAVRW